METKTVQIEYEGDSAVISYYLGDDPVGKPVSFKPIPKHLKLLIEKFPAATSEKGANVTKSKGELDEAK